MCHLIDEEENEAEDVGLAAWSVKLPLVGTALSATLRICRNGRQLDQHDINSCRREEHRKRHRQVLLSRFVGSDWIRGVSGQKLVVWAKPRSTRCARSPKWKERSAIPQPRRAGFPLPPDKNTLQRVKDDRSCPLAVCPVETRLEGFCWRNWLRFVVLHGVGSFLEDARARSRRHQILSACRFKA